MAFEGQIARIPFGDGGLQTDDPHTKILPTKLVIANNVTMANGVAEKDFGSRIWNDSAVLPAGVKQFIDWWPNISTQRLIAVLKDGTVQRFVDRFSFAEVTPATGAPTTLNVSNYVSIVSGGEEETGNNRKLFIFTGYNVPQVISGDGVQRTNIQQPAADWTATTHPVTGIIHNSRLWALMGHNVYASAADDHEDFSSPLLFTVYPGESERLICAFVWRKKLHVAKYPSGIYRLEDDDSNSANWYFSRVIASMGTISPGSGAEVFDDFLIGNEYGGITSLGAAQEFGDLKTADIFNLMRIENFVADEVQFFGYNDRQAFYYKRRKQLLMTFKGVASNLNNRICQLTFRSPSEGYVTWTDKDQPNCLAGWKDSNGIERPMYGAEDGYLYVMDQVDRWVGTEDSSIESGYNFEIMTPHMDFGPADPSWANRDKEYTMLEVEYLPTGRFAVSIDVFIDGVLSKTVECDLGSDGRDLGEMKLNDPRQVDPSASRFKRFDLLRNGRRIAFRCYNDTAGQNVKLVGLKVYFNVLGQTDQEGAA